MATSASAPFEPNDMVSNRQRMARSTGMARKVDELGRMVLPSELRRRFRIHEGDYLGIHVENQRIILTKLESGCVFCDSGEGLRPFQDKYVCSGCLAGLEGLRGA